MGYIDPWPIATRMRLRRSQQEADMHKDDESAARYALADPPFVRALDPNMALSNGSRFCCRSFASASERSELPSQLSRTAAIPC
jgi:hypothetical protein